jgi:N utilization substance protein B
VAKSEEYEKYIMNDQADHLEMLLELYRFCRADDFFNEIIEDIYFNWMDDKSLVIGSIKKCFKASPNLTRNFFKGFYPDDETVKEYGEILFQRTFEEDKMLLQIIKPLLKNWDHERLALIDTILIKMAIVEMLYCETIPTKVTINEYVEVSKMYSTPKSKDFINGILDKVLKTLQNDGKIVKKGRGLVE